MNHKIMLFLFIVFASLRSFALVNDTIPLKGNAYITSPDNSAHFSGRNISRRPPITRDKEKKDSPAWINERDGGISNWSNTNTIVSTYFAIEKTGKIDLSIRAKGNSVIQVMCEGKIRKVKLSSDDFKTIKVGVFNISKPGYVKIDFRALRSKNDADFGDITDLYVSGDVGAITYIKPDFSTHFGRRGPSVHLNYRLPKDKTIEWFYNEVTVPNEGDMPASYYMACGFGEGYFGFQNNSPQKRRVLFSVWSPYHTDNAKEIPDSLRVKMLRQGTDVKVNDFGGEGAGGQSFLQYEWEPGRRYRFLMQVKPLSNNNTSYTAYFYSPTEDKWRLIASFQRPVTNTWYRNAHSFLENFSPNMGYKSRMASYDNQWACTNQGEWIPIYDATFTHDETGRNGKRLDYTGGFNDGGFYLKMGGFFDENTKGGTPFKRKTKGQKPSIDFKELDEL